MFTQSCFIRKNTKYLIDKLEELGYSYKGKSSNSAELTCLYCCLSGYYECTEIPGRFETPIDCGTNEDLFLAIAALRDDTDKNQWFASNYFDKNMNPDSFVKCTTDDYKEFFGDCPYIRNYDDYHKATVNELIKFFNKTYTNESTDQAWSIRD